MKYVFIFLILMLQLYVGAQVMTFSPVDSSKMNMDLVKTLDNIYKEDQETRNNMTTAIKNKESKDKIDSLRNIMREKDKELLIKVDKIIDEHGWLGPQDVGFQPSQGLFLVIQHADLATQKKYYPIIKKAEKEGKIFSANVAILEDRIAMREGRKQLYGSQGFTDSAIGKSYPYPIEDPDNIDERRKKMGLGPYKEYKKDWDLEQYKKQLPEIEKMAKAQNIK